MAFPFVEGDTGPEILEFQHWFGWKYESYAPPATGTYGAADVAAVKELQRRTGMEPTGEFDRPTAKRANYPMPKHLAIVFRGTGGVIGEDLVSLVCQAVSDLVIEENPEWPATMGGFPVGTAGGIGDISMKKAVDIAFEAGKRTFLRYLEPNPNIKVIIGGYSAGAVVAMLLRRWILENYPDNYLCSFSFGDPTRPEGGCFYKGTPAKGHGISSDRWGDIKDYRHCWLANKGDMYTSVWGAAGEILVDGYDGVTKIQFSDPVTTIQAVITMIIEMMQDSGIGLPQIVAGLLAGPAGFVTFLIPMVIGALQGMISELVGLPDATKASTEAAAEAAIIGLKFAGAQPPTKPHISYHVDEVPGLGGMTYLDLAIQHVRDFATSVTPT
ncbi:peptidoglycan-binding domain-containing protein [Mycobacterium paragordonae]|uniref:Peptidoglycan-binding domain-containing protein n=1 Tax=Mycobacterium paragordonae TaxID=1389713 RepID=A0AAJ1RZE5_9MYCO|nr:peptidoglycan-binding domain-containing protein [Mycobacterium paragordonae]MDP7733652.1 peptidoglycan-binding domain-containing protein [Mycobacterium paragordonae]